jgi:hypothetical protein
MLYFKLYSLIKFDGKVGNSKLKSGTGDIHILK